jgi:hypothetical protein
VKRRCKDEIISTRATAEDIAAAASTMAQAAELARSALDEDDICVSAAMWARLLGSNCDGAVFELPSFCNADGTQKMVVADTLVTPGATRAPAGPGRYA